MTRYAIILLFSLLTAHSFGQLLLARDTISVLENNRVLKMPWANGINYSNVSTIDLNLDGKKDVVAFDRVNRYGVGRFRCFINTGNPGDTKYKADPDMSYTFPPVSNWAVFFDYNNDGLEDLFCSTSLGITVYKNVSTAAQTPSFALVKPLLYANYNPIGQPSYANLYASTIGVPGIADVDNDGDLDIMTFSSQGVFIELYKNVGLEKYNKLDSLVFDYANDCWGKLSESMCQVEFNACGGNRTGDHNHKTYHAGSCLMCMDSDGDLDQDLILGDVSCSIVQYIHNTGTPGNTGAFFTDTTKLYPNYPNKNSTLQINLNAFPCTYFADVDNDSKKDLIATPNVSTGENYNSLWYYKNTSSTGTVNFQFVKKNFLQDEMIEVGQNSFPLVFDYNADGLKDLLIGTDGYYTNDTLRTQLTLYKNIGTASQPSYSLITRDYANLGQQHLNGAMPTIGDIDGDGDIDLCIGTSNGQVHWLENTAGANTPCNFSVFHNNPFSFTTLSAEAAPQLFDVDNDTKLDLVIGMQNGRLAYYRNIGTSTAPSFSLITNTFGQVNVTNSSNQFGIDGYAVPYLYKDGPDTKALIGSVNGFIHYYIVPSNPSSAFYEISPQVNAFNEGGQASVCYEDVNGDGKRDLFIGNASGGLSFFSSLGPNVGLQNISPDELKAAVTLFPNPVGNTLTINIDKLEFNSGTVTVTDVVGKEVLQQPLYSNQQLLDVTSLKAGIYFVTVVVSNHSKNFQVTQKIIRSH